MDISNLKEKAPKIKSGLELESMYELNYRQIEGYKPIEHLPDYPLDINIPKNQTLLKALISQVVEELMEGYESTSDIQGIMISNGWNLNILSESEEMVLLSYLQNANEEQADALGFFLSALSYSNILPEDIYSFGNNEILDEGSTMKVFNLENVMCLGYQLIYNKYNLYEIIGNLAKNRHSVVRLEVYNQVNEYIKGMYYTNESIHELEKHIIFDIVYTLNMARNTLKNRTWKQTQVMTKELEFQERLVKAFYYYMGYLYMMDFTPQGLYKLFFKKERLNEWRQKSNY